MIDDPEWGSLGVEGYGGLAGYTEYSLYSFGIRFPWKGLLFIEFDDLVLQV